MKKAITPAQKAAWDALLKAVRAIPRDCFIEVDDFDGTLMLYQRITPGWAREVYSARIGMKRVSL